MNIYCTCYAKDIMLQGVSSNLSTSTRQGYNEMCHVHPAEATCQSVSIKMLPNLMWQIIYWSAPFHSTTFSLTVSDQARMFFSYICFDSALCSSSKKKKYFYLTFYLLEDCFQGNMFQQMVPCFFLQININFTWRLKVAAHWIVFLLSLSYIFDILWQPVYFHRLRRWNVFHL